MVHLSISLQLHIELEVSGLEIIGHPSKPNIGYSSALAELKGYQDAWRNFRLDPVVEERIIPDVPDVPDMEWDIKHGAYIGGFRESDIEHPDDNQLDRIQVIHLCSPVAPPPLDFKKKFNDFTLDMVQSLVVLVEYVIESSGSAFAYVHLHHTDTGLPHPLARLPTLPVRFQDTWDSIEPDILVLDNILVITFLGPGYITNGYDTLIWNWKSSLLLGRIHSETSADISFLDKGHLVLFSLLDSVAESNQVALHVYRVPTATTDSHQEPPYADYYAPSCPKLKPVLSLQFPKVHATYRLQGYALASVPLLGDPAFRGSTNVVHSHTTTIALQLLVTPVVKHVTIMMHAMGMGDLDYCIFVNTNRIFDYLSDNRTQETVVMDWPQWGPAASRWFIDSDSLSASAVEAFGSLYPLWNLNHHGLGVQQYLSIFEFNPQLVQRHMYASKSTNEKSVLEARGPSGRVYTIADLKTPLFMAIIDTDTDQDTVTHMIGSDSKTIITKGFEEPVESSLPFMVVTRVHPMPKHQAWHIQGNYLVGVVSDLNARFGLELTAPFKPIESLGDPRRPLSLYKLQPAD